jgi:hypothetical protein
MMPLVTETSFFRRLVLGRRYIEGTWIQWAKEPGSKRGLSIIEIQPHYESFVVTGEHFVIADGGVDSFGKSFDIKPIEFIWPKLLYYYSTTPVMTPGESADTEGVGHFNFSSAETYEGTYSYGGLRGRAQVKGRKATREEVKALSQVPRDLGFDEQTRC